MTSRDGDLLTVGVCRDASFAPPLRSEGVNPVFVGRARSSSLSPVLARQKGAILVIAVFFFFVLCAGLLVVFNTAQVSTEKRHLVNAADAIAYSTANVAAEGLNYTAYTNRAMIGNYESVGNMIGMWSVMGMSDQYWKNSSTLFGALAELVKFIPWVGSTFSTIANAISKFGQGWEKVTGAVRFGAKVLANVGTAAESVANYALFASQQLHLATTISALGEIQNPLLQANAPKAEYDPATIAYQVVKSIVDFGSMMKPFRPPGHFVRSMTQKAIPNAGEKHNLVHRMMTTDMFIQTNPLNGRRLLPNAVGLWMSDGCQFGPWAAFNGILTGMNTNGLSSIFPFLGSSNWVQGAASAVEIFMNTIGLLASPITCLFDRVGGTRTMQMQDGSYGWSSVDVMPMNLLGFDIPLAGGVTLSRVGALGNPTSRNMPEDLERFAEYVQGGAMRTQQWGQTTTPEDCVYLTLPSGDVWEPRVGGACLSEGAGEAKQYYNRGAMNIANGPTWSAMKGSGTLNRAESHQGQTILSTIMGPLTAATGAITSFPTTPPNSPTPTFNIASGLILGGVMAGMPATGGGLTPPPAGSAAEAARLTSAFDNIAQQFANGSSSMLSGNFRDSLRNAITTGITVPADPSDPTAGPGAFVKFILDALGIGKFYDLLTMRSSMGTEVLGYTKGNGKNFSPDLQLPLARLWMWEIRGSEKGEYMTGDLDNSTLFEATPEIQEASLHNLGPTFTVGLRQPIGTVEIAEKKHMTPGKLVLPNWDATKNTPYLRAIGKARVYFRAPLERWVTRQQLVPAATLMLPYWNARLEGLSYPEKALFSLTQLSGKL